MREVAGALAADYAVLWRLEDDRALLVWEQDWAAGEGLETLRALVRRLTFEPGVGLPGTALEAAEPVVVEDPAGVPALPRADAFGQAGLRLAVAVPLQGPDGPTGVMEFFAREPAPPSPGRLREATTAGRQLAAYLGR